MRQIIILIVALLWMNQSYAAFNLKQFDNPEHATRYEDLIYQYTLFSLPKPDNC